MGPLPSTSFYSNGFYSKRNEYSLRICTISVRKNDLSWGFLWLGFEFGRCGFLFEFLAAIWFWLNCAELQISRENSCCSLLFALPLFGLILSLILFSR
ncbi:hypothetical protein A4A49_20184 [Nicotiana attenuata]|uniref:Uncharacterized protein n=1 Tax=Nicotiana attenuata TaxID=49451 RepID=A0A1J6INJ5_NICAT|nr:hypothetical protein A4A49_20184 [Nicotiana attenuata]